MKWGPRLLNRRFKLQADTPEEKRLDPELVEYRNNGARSCVVFLHGFTGGAAATWARFPEFLMEERRLATWDVYGLGYATSFRIDIPVIQSDPDLPLLSQSVVTAFRLPPLARYRRIALIAHSMGGLVAQRAALDSRVKSRLTHLITFGTPSAGLRGLFFLPKRQLRDMSASSAFIRALRADWANEFNGRTPFRFISVAGENDDVVSRESAFAQFSSLCRDVVPGNHLTMVKPDGQNHRSIRLVIDAIIGGRADVCAAIDPAALDNERGDFTEVVSTLLPRYAQLDDGALVELALALDALDREQDAIQILEECYDGGRRRDTDVMGVLAGRIKRRWLHHREATDLERAVALYSQAYQLANVRADHEQAYYHAINVAALMLLSSSRSGVPQEATLMALGALEHCRQSPASTWRSATEGEAHLILGDLDDSEIGYADAVRRGAPRQIESMYLQATKLAQRTGNREAVAMVENVFNAVARGLPKEEGTAA